MQLFIYLFFSSLMPREAPTSEMLSRIWYDFLYLLILNNEEKP